MHAAEQVRAEQRGHLYLGIDQLMWMLAVVFFSLVVVSIKSGTVPDATFIGERDFAC